MKKTNKRGFTIVELVIVIAVIAILAAVLIPTFSNIVKKANESAELQELKNRELQQKIDDLEKEIADKDSWLSWDDIKKVISDEIAKVNGQTLTATDVTNIVSAVINARQGYGSNSGITQRDLELLLKDALKDLNYTGLTADEVRKIIEDAIDELGNINQEEKISVNVTNIEQAMADGGEFILSDDIVIGNAIGIDSGKNISLDLSGKTITTVGEYNSIEIDNQSYVSFSNGTIVNNALNEEVNNSKYAITAYAGCTINLDGVHITGSNKRAVGVLSGTIIVSCKDSDIDGYIFCDLGSIVLAHEGIYKITSEMMNMGIPISPSVSAAEGYKFTSIEKTGSDGIKYMEYTVSADE